MIDPDNLPSIDRDELLARYIVQRKDIWAKTQKVKPDAFIPPRSLRLSVTRHREATDHELWDVGEEVARQRGKPLRGRADVYVHHCYAQGLDVEAAPICDNPNHADVLGWPERKEEQKKHAMALATSAMFTPR